MTVSILAGLATCIGGSGWALAAVAAGVAAALLADARRRTPRPRSSAGSGVGVPAERGVRALLQDAVPPLGPVERAGLTAGAVLVVVRPAMAAVVLTGALASLVAERAQARRAQVGAHRAAVRTGVAAVAAALRAGLPAMTAWATAIPAPELPHPVAGEDASHLLGPVAVAAQLGLDVADALEAVSRQPGADALRRVAVCWRVTEGAGSGLAGSLERLVEGLREDDELRGTVDAELASARTTGRLLAALPLLGIAGAAALGTPPRQLLLDTTVGRVCTLAAAVLEVGGLLWLRRLAASVS